MNILSGQCNRGVMQLCSSSILCPWVNCYHKIINLFGNKPEVFAHSIYSKINMELSLKYTARIEIFTLKQFLFYPITCLSKLLKLI